MKILAAVVLVLALATPTFSRTMDRCSLANEMFDLGVPKDELPRWTCIAEHESSFRTGVVGKTNSNGSNDYGIFQINNNWWCQPADGRFSYNECKVDCDSLLTDEINASVTCALQIKKQQGWTAWAVWKYCNGTLPAIDDCFATSTCS